MSEPLVTARELGELLGLSANTVLDWFESGRLPGFRLGGNKGGPVRFRLSEIEGMLKSWHVNGPGAGGGVPPTPRRRPARELVSHVPPTPPQGGD